jgi:hypothetical protein
MACLLVFGHAEAKKKPPYAGFLTDYAKLEKDPDNKEALVWQDPGADPCQYSKAILEPIAVHLEAGVKADESVTEEDLEAMKQYLYAVELSGEPGPGVMRVRLAITDLLKAKSAMQVLPQTKLIGAGRGGASMEGELLDSQSGEVIVAVVQAGKAGRFDGVKKWSHAKSVVDGWGERLEKRLAGWGCD